LTRRGVWRDWAGVKGILRSLIALMAATGGTPPTELRIFAKGKNASTKGEFIFDEKAAKAVMAAAAERGVEFPFDYNHGSTDPLGMLNPEMSGKAAGWCKLTIRNGELWATEIRWTESALKAIAAAEWRYVSPTFAHDKNNHVTALWAIALTNTPALHNLDPLVAASLTGEEPDERNTMEPLLVALGLAATASVTDALTAITVLRTQVQQLLTATGKATLSEALGAIEGLKAASVQVTTLSGKLAELEAATRLGEVNLLVEGALKDGKLAPAQKDWALSLGKADVAQLKGFLSTAPKIVGAAHEPKKGTEDETVQLTAEEAEGCRKVGLDPKKYLESKAASIARRTAAA
jgi:phage I-like protein